MTGNRLWTIGVVVIIAAVVVIGWFLAISPVVGQAAAAEQDAQSIEAQNASSDASLAALQAQFAKLPQIQAQLATLQGAAPSSVNLDDFLDQLQNLAQSTGVTITSFTASEATAYGSAAGAAGASTAPTPSVSPSPGASASPGATVAPPTATTGGALAGKLFTVPVTLNLTGPADNIMAFTKAAQTGPRFFLVTGATFSGASNPSLSAGSLTGYVFVVREPGTPAAGSGTSPTPTPTPTPTVTPTPTRTPTPTPTATTKP